MSQTGGAEAGAAGAPERKLRLGVLASHFGSNLQAILDACREGRLDARVAVVISNNSAAEALRRAEREGVPAVHLSSKTHPDAEKLDLAMAETLERHGAELVVLAGYMKKIGPITLGRFAGRMLNTHPALLPKFGGEGMYGDRVHAAVLAAGEEESGVSIHRVTDEYDAGPVIAQARVPVRPDDDVASLSERVRTRERELLVSTLQEIALGRIALRG